MIRNSAIVLFICLLVAGCGEMQTQRVDKLNEAVEAYGQALRWGRYSDADLFQVAKDGTRTRIDEKTLADIRITDYTVLNQHLNEDATSADVSGEIEYFNTSYATVQKVPFTQKWWYNDKLKHWLVESPLPKFK